MSYPYESAKTKETGIALWILERHEWAWKRLVNTSMFIKRKEIAARAAALVAHDRVLTGEFIERGFPSFYGDK